MKSNSILFAAEATQEVTARICRGTPTSVIGIPSAGISLFVKHLATEPLGYTVLVDAFSLTSLTTHNLFTSLLHKLGQDNEPATTDDIVIACKRELQNLVKEHERVVICITGIDLLYREFNDTFFGYLRSLRSVDPSKVVFVFGICRRLETLLPSNLTNIDISLFSSVYYLKPYSPNDLKYLLNKYGPQTELEPEEEKRLIELSGGHFRFLQLLINSENRTNPAQDPFIELAFQNIYQHLSQQQQTTIRALASGKKVASIDEYLLKVGLVRVNGEDYELFSTLFRDCVRLLTAAKLPLKERRLLSVLKKHKGGIVSKREICDAVWKGNEVGSEWALNALIYRLRKHPGLAAQGYAIESHKKLGYRLIKTI